MATNVIGFSKFVLRFVFVSYCLNLASANEYVPVYMWGTCSDFESEQPIPALTLMKPDEFKAIIDHKLEGMAVVVFIEDKLSVEDFSWQERSGKFSFPNLKSLAEKSDGVTFLPNVYSPMHTLDSWTNEWVQAALYEHGLEPDVTLTNETLVYVSLLDGVRNEYRPELLKGHDSFMAEFYKKFVETHGCVVAIYTGEESSQEPDDDTPTANAMRPKRDAVENTTIIISGNNQILLYTSESIQLTLVEQNLTLSEYDDSTVVVEELEIAEGKLVTVLSVVFLTEPETTLVNFTFHEPSTRYWNLRNITVEYKGTSHLMIANKVMEAPYNFSYHCGQGVVFREKPQKAGDPVINYLTFNSIQVQAYMDGARFDDAYDCVYFFTVPILSGFMVSILLAWIMGFGICMIMDIKTMDRFDDPKGKTITINAD